MVGDIISTHKYKSGDRTKHNSTSKVDYCTGHCVVCPKTKTVMQIGVDVYIEPNRMVIRDKQYRISNPMFRILCAFHEHQEEVLSRDFLLAYAWGENNTVNNSVTVAISELRGLLSSKSGLEIATVQGKGYRMFKTYQDICQ
jgi:DNA-binding response OmpR family regulator